MKTITAFEPRLLSQVPDGEMPAEDLPWELALPDGDPEYFDTPLSAFQAGVKYCQEEDIEGYWQRLIVCRIELSYLDADQMKAIRAEEFHPNGGAE